ncbi:MAG: hypothetical protein IPJ87_10905 [Flavobacteriales bacterium]|jgi:capsule polysaccharide export protein KpsE/RkpR|nr:hypothetical protein [Flavobacteriales bacterium]MBK7942362.1 hypothetical protein [Flavobacteriales bacterium]MBK8948177.1 hypothetical protein [Flavobacteriales bacterium]MBK9699237.1 hypothetical protein [Flavobacteriales bacterium]
MAAELDLSHALTVLRRGWRTMALTALVALVLSAVLSGPTFIAPRYRSSATVFPVNLTSYSIETRTDQLLQLLESNSIRDSLVQRFDLARHYEIDITKPPGRFYLDAEYHDRVEIGKTRFESVQIEVTDEDPQLARDMVQEILRQTDLLARRLQREKSHELLAISEREMAIAKHKLDSVETRLDQLRRETGLLDYDAQTEEVTRGYLRMQSGGASGAAREEARGLLKALGEKGGEFRQLTELSTIFRDNYVARLNDVEKARTDVNKVLTYTNVVGYPEVADKKVFPVRWLIVLISMASALFLAYVLLALRHRP